MALALITAAATPSFINIPFPAMRIAEAETRLAALNATFAILAVQAAELLEANIIPSPPPPHPHCDHEVTDSNGRRFCLIYNDWNPFTTCKWDVDAKTYSGDNCAVDNVFATLTGHTVEAAQGRYTTMDPDTKSKDMTDYLHPQKYVELRNTFFKKADWHHDTPYTVRDWELVLPLAKGGQFSISKAVSWPKIEANGGYNNGMPENTIGSCAANCRVYYKNQCSGQVTSYGGDYYSKWQDSKDSKDRFWCDTLKTDIDGDGICSGKTAPCDANKEDAFGNDAGTTDGVDKGYLVDNVPPGQIWWGDTDVDNEIGAITLGPLECEITTC